MNKRDASDRRALSASMILLGFFGWLFVAGPGRSCSYVASDLHGVIDSEGAVSYLKPTRDEERPGTYRWLDFSQTGAFLGEREVRISWADVSVSPLIKTRDGRLWVRVWCFRDQGGAHCGAIQEVLADGGLGRRWPSPPGRSGLRAVGDRLLLGTVENQSLEIRELDLETGAWRLLRAVRTGDRYPLDGHGTTWGVGPDGEVVLAFGGGKQVTLVRLDAEDREIARARFPAARSGFDPVDEDGVRRLGPFARILVGDDGVVMAWQGGNDPSCFQYQPPSIALFGRDLEHLGVADNEGHIRAYRRVGPELRVVGTYGPVKRFAFDGDEIESWTPEIPSVGDEATRYQTWQEMRAAAAALVPESTLVDRIALFEAAEDAMQARIDDWWVAEGPATYAALDDRGWQRLASRFCDRHPTRAPAEALRRFDRTRGHAKGRWLEAIVACFDAPIPRVVEHAEHIADSQNGRSEAQVVFEAWGYGPKRLDALWRTVLETPLTRGTEVRAEAIQLLRAFPQTADAFDRALTGPDASAHERVRRMLLESTYLWGHRYAYRIDDTVRAARSAMLRSAGRWSEDERPAVRAVGQLLRLGHLDFVDHPPGEPARLVESLIDSARREPRLWPWIALALDQAIEDEASFRALGDESADWLVAASQESSAEPLEPLMLDYSTADPWRFLTLHGGTRSVGMLAAHALTDEATTPGRNRLLRRLAARPWALDPDAMLRLLEAPWLTDPDIASTSLIGQIGSVAEPGGDLHARLVRRLLERLSSTDAASRVRSHALLFDSSVRLYGSSLVDALGVPGVREIVDNHGQPFEWLRLIAQVGAWTEIEATLEPMLAGPRNNVRVEVAAALAPSRHPKALEILLETIERGEDDPVALEALGHFGDQARPRVETLCAHENAHVRSRARLALRALGPDPDDIESLRAAADEAFAEARLPDVATVLMLHEAGDDTVPRLLAHLDASPKLRLDSYSLGYRESLDFPRVILAWLRDRKAPDPETPKSLRELVPWADPDARHWLDALETLAADH